MKNTDLEKRIIKKYKLKDKENITLQKFLKISEAEKIEIEDLISILGICKNNKTKIINKTIGKMRINLNKENYDEKSLVKLIKINLKYLRQYKYIYYSKKSIEKICKKYSVEFTSFIKYIYPRKRNYKENLIVLENNPKGLWIGEDTDLNNDFLFKNYKKLMVASKCASNRIIRHYGCTGLREELEFESLCCIIKKGIIQRNFIYNEEYLFNKLKKAAEYKALNYMIKKKKEVSYESIIEGETNKQYIENFLDEKYNPEHIIDSNIKIKNIKLKKLHREITQTIKGEILNETKAKSILHNTNKKLNITKEKFNAEIVKLQEKIINQGLVKVCKNGQVIIMYEKD